MVINDVAASRQGTSPFVMYWWFTTGIMALFLVVVLAVEKLAEAAESGGSPDPHLLRGVGFEPSAYAMRKWFVRVGI